MGELKFRAWDTFNECYYYSEKFENLAKFFEEYQKYIDGGNKLIFEEWIRYKDWYESDLIKDKRADVVLEIIWNPEDLRWDCYWKLKEMKLPLYSMIKHCMKIKSKRIKEAEKLAGNS